jgi:NarL family two-component system response regulator LiaR
MRKTILLYGIAMAVLIGLLKFLEYRYFVRDLSIEFYIGAIAIMFVALGVWVGMRLNRVKVQKVVEVIEVEAKTNFTFDESELKRLGISRREHEVLELISQGLSNQEIAEKLFVSLSTIKTHSANLFMKLDANRRTQAVQKARELRLIP